MSDAVVNRAGDDRMCRGCAAALLALVLAMCLPPLLIAHDAPTLHHWHEAASLQTSQETWMRMHAGEHRAWLIPSNNGQPRLRKPPMLVWVNLLAWIDLNPATATHEQLIGRARLANAAIAMVMLLGVFWIGCSLHDGRAGLFAVAIAGSTLFFQSQARLAGYDLQYVAWVTLAIGAWLWEFSPRQEPNRARAVIASMLAGVFLAMSTMTKLPGPGVFVIPCVIAIALARQRRWRRIVGMLVSFVVATAIVLPWLLHVLHMHPDAIDLWLNESGGPPGHVRPWTHYLDEALILLTLPWTLWVIAGLVHPFVSAAGEARRASRMPWLWCVLMLAIFCAVPAKAQRYIFPLVPALALLAGQVWRDHERQGATLARDRGAALLTHAHWIGLLIASLVLPGALVLRDRLIERGWVESFEVIAIPWPVGAGLVVLLVALALAGWRQHRSGRHLAATILTAVWMSCVMTAGWYASAGAPRPDDAVQRDAAALMQRIEGGSIRHLQCEYDDRPENAFLFFTRLVISPVRVDDLYDPHRPMFVLAPDSPAHAKAMRGANYKAEGDYHDKGDRVRRLWIAPAPGASESATPVESSPR